MATVTTNSYGGRYLQLDVWEESYNIKDNYSVVRWKLQSIGGSSMYYNIYNWGVWVHDQTIYNWGTTVWTSGAFPAAKGSREGTINVYHNADGSVGNISFTLAGCVYWNRTEQFYGSIGLTQANRNITTWQSLNSKTPNSITMNWSTSNNISGLWYTLNGGGWNGTGISSGSSGTYTISGLSPNTTYSIVTIGRRSDTGRDGASSALSIATYQAYSAVTSCSVGDLMPFTCTAYCTSSNTANTSTYEYAICDKNKNPLLTYTSSATYYNFSGLSEETSYYLRCRVQSKDSGVWSGYSYSALFTTPADQSKGYIKKDGAWSLGKVYYKKDGAWVKAKKTYLKKDGSWAISKNP